MEGIIVGVDESPYARAALRWAVAHGARTAQPVTAVMAWGYIDQRHLEPDAPFDPQYSAAAAAEVLDELVARALGADHDVARVAVCDRPAPGLLATAGDDATMIVVGARGMGGFRALLLGSVSRQVLHRATCPVAVIRDDATRLDGPVVVGVDGSEPSHRALQWAVACARTRRTTLVALYAWHPPDAVATFAVPWPAPDELTADATAVLAEQLGRVDTSGLIEPVECRPVADRPAAALVAASSLASLVVVGSRGHGQLTGTLLGSVSDQVAHHATSPVVVVP